MSFSERRAAIAQLWRAGYKQCEIFKLLRNNGESRQNIYNVVKSLTERGTTDRRPGSGRPRSVRTKQLIKRVRERLRRNPQQSLRKMAVSLNRNRETIRLVVKKDFGFRPYKLRKVAGLSNRQKKLRLERSKNLLARHGDEDLENIVFSDEKLFKDEQLWNSQNNRVYGLSLEHIPEHLRTVRRFQHAKSVMIFGAISMKGKFPLVFVEQGVKINQASYERDILEPCVKAYGHTLFLDQPWTFQQDNAPAHKAKKTQQWCERELPDFIRSEDWPPSSPDLSPLDYGIWGYLEAKVNACTARSPAELRRRIVREWDKLPMEVVRAAIAAWRKRLRLCVRARGGRFE